MSEASELRARLEELAEVEKAETAYERALEAYRGHEGDPKLKAAYKKAAKEFSDARQAQREKDEAAGIRVPMTKVAGAKGGAQ